MDAVAGSRRQEATVQSLGELERTALEQLWDADGSADARRRSGSGSPPATSAAWR